MKRLFTIICALAVFSGAYAQQYRTTYFMPGSTLRNELNPAMLPSRGYVALPGVGMVTADITSPLSLDNIFYPKNGELVTFLDSSVPAGEFISKLSDINKVDVNLGTKIFGLGFYRGKSFFSFDANLKMETQADLPRELFEFLKYGSGVDGTTYNIKDASVAADIYAEFAVGYARQIIPNLTVGVKVKYLGGVAHAKYHFDEFNVSLQNDEWKVTSKGVFEMACNGMTMGSTYENGKEHYDFSDMDFSSFGLAGGGLALDFGAEYKLAGIVNLSASVLNLGKVSWKESNMISGVSHETYNFSGFNIIEGTDTNEINTDDFNDLLKFTPISSTSEKSKLTSTILLGAEVPLVPDVFSLGALYTYQMRALFNSSQLTLSANLNLFKWLSGALSYSIQGQNSGSETFGAFLNIHPSFINFYVGSDFIYKKVSKQYIPIDQKNANIYFGISIPLGRKTF